MIFVVTLLDAQRIPKVQNPPKAQNSQLDEYKSFALASPPAPGSDALLRLVAIGSNESPSWRRSLIEQAFELAVTVPTATAYKPVPIGFTDSIPATTAISSRLIKVDRLSLQVRAAEAMIDIDRARALEMFESIPIPTIPPLSCKALVVPDVSSYYNAVRAFAEQCFGDTSNEREKRKAFVGARVSSISSSVQVYPSIRLLIDLQVPGQDREALVNVLASSVASIRDDDRSFTLVFLDEESAQLLRTLVTKCRAEGIDTSALVSSMREFYSTHLTAPRCSDTATDNVLRRRLEHGVKLFNAVAKEYSVGTPALSDDTNAERLEDSAIAKDLWKQSPKHSDFIKQLSGLASDPAPTGSEHKTRISDLISSIDTWHQPDNLDSLEFFILKAQLLNQVLQISADADNFRSAIVANVRLFERSKNEQLMQPALWIRAVSSVLTYARSRGDSAAEIARGDFEKSSEPALHLYAELDRYVSRLGRPEKM